MQKLIIVGLALAFAGAAFAGSLPSANSGSLSVYVPGQFAAPTTQPRYQGAVAFNATGTARLKNPRVWVACYQSGALVYGEGTSPSGTLKLGGDMSQWVRNGGGPANCSAVLYYLLNAKGTGEWNGNGAQGGKVELGHAAFDAAG